MPTFVALLRGINVGKAKRIPMAELRALLEELGYAKVQTLLNSGNAVFQAAEGKPARYAAEISGAILSKLGLEVPVMVRSARELADVVAENPFAAKATDHTRLLLAFATDTKALSELEPIGRLVAPPEEFIIGQHAAYLHCVTGIRESKAGLTLLGKAGKSATSRNWATVLKLQALVDNTQA